MILVVGGILLVRQNDHARSDEPRDVVHMAMRIIAHTPRAEPDRLTDAEILTERALVADPIEARITYLDVGEQPLLRHEQRPFAVRLDAAAFEDQPRTRVPPLRL